MIVSSKDEYTTTLSALDDPAQARYGPARLRAKGSERRRGRTDLQGWSMDACPPSLLDSVLRDKLAADDRMELALDVAARCNVEAAPVWSAWGLVKLRMRQFLPARDKLKNFFGAWRSVGDGGGRVTLLPFRSTEW